MQEDLVIAQAKRVSNLTPQIRRLHLVVTALREFFISFEKVLKRETSSNDKKKLLEIKGMFLFEKY